MPFRKRIKERIKQVADDLSSLLQPEDAEGGTTRPNTPANKAPHSDSLVVGEQTGDQVTSLPKTTPYGKIAASQLNKPQSKDISYVDEGFKESVRLTNPIQEDRVSVMDVGDRSSIAAPVNSGTFKLTDIRQVDSDLVSGDVDPDKADAAERQKLGYTPQIVSDVSSTKWKGLKGFTRVLEPVTNAFGPIKDMAELFVECVDKCEMMGGAKTEYEALRVRLEGIFEDLNEYFGEGCALTMTSSMEGLCRLVQTELDYIKKQQHRNIGERYLSAADESDKVLACYRRIEGHLQRLSNSRSDRMSSFVDRLPSSLSAWYDSAEGIELKRRQCTPGTRVNVLANVLDWARGAGCGVYWLNGMAGTGKTTIAYSVCADLDSRRQLGANFFCSRLREECRNVNVIIPSIAYQLARFSRPYQSALSTVLEKDPDVHGRLPHLQFDALIAKPMLEVQHTLPEGMTVVMTHSTNASKKRALHACWIRDQMTSERTRSRLVLHELDKGEVQADIEKYLREGLTQMSPSETQIAALVERAGILFIYAATAVRYIGYDNFHRNPSARLRTILDRPQGRISTQSTEVDQLYATIIEAALGDEGLEEDDRMNMRQVLYTVICAREPLTVDGISELLQINDTDCVRGALRPLWSVLHVVVGSELVTTLHASFPDFMFDPTRSKAYHCDSEAHDRILAEHCLKHIEATRPEFNICGLESSYLPDHAVPNIHKRVADAISSHLLYACRYWAHHVEAGKCASTLVPQLQDFLSRRLLVWMEVLNLNRQMRAGVECMKLMIEWYSIESDEELVDLTEGTTMEQRQLAHLATWVFGDVIRAMAMSQDGRHIALGVGCDVLVVDSSSGQFILGPLHGHSKKILTIMFSPDHTRLFAGSRDYDSGTATVIGWDTRTGDTVVGPLQLHGPTSPSSCLRFSPDCTCIATGFYGHNLWLWDIAHGKMLRCLETHGSVLVAAFSLDGIQIAAGLNNALQIWNSQTGDTTLGPLSTPLIEMIAFSPDSSRIIHAQKYTNNIQVRSAQTGQLIYQLYTGNEGRTRSIGYSPDSRYIVSGHPRTVKVWDAQTGRMKLGPLEGSPNDIAAIVFSPDGSRIISAYQDGLVCTWDARQHYFAHSSISMRTTGILSAKFSPDGHHFVFGSSHGSLHIWDSHTGAMTAGHTKAHTAEIIGVDFINDRVISGSEDGLIAVCNAQSGDLLRSLTIAHGHRIGCIAFSPNGDLIVTGSSLDRSLEVNLWDAQTGTKLLDPLTGFRCSISSVQFSPDGTRIAAGSIDTDKQVVIWGVADGRNLLGFLNGHTEPVESVSYSHDGTLVASGPRDNTVIVWDAYTGSKVLGPLVGHSYSVQSVHFSPGSIRLVSSSDDGTICIWDVHTGEMMFELLHGHEQIVRSVAYSPDGTRILSVSWDMTVRIHDAQSPKERAQSRSTTEFGDWVMNKEGWVVDDQLRLLAWVPGDLRRTLKWPRTDVVASPRGYVSVKFDKSRMGESWAQSYTL
ncbi:vegetative incompatibility protein HET-E-1, putative, partial [Rhizoctonia solani AG-3 Rhs1AP]